MPHTTHLQILRQLFTVHDADGSVPTSAWQPAHAHAEDDPQSDSDDDVMDTQNGHTVKEKGYRQPPVRVTNLRPSYSGAPEDTPAAWRYGADALESDDFSIEHPLEPGLKLFFMADPTHVLKSQCLRLSLPSGTACITQHSITRKHVVVA